MKRPIVHFDIETTGLNQTSDRIIEIFMLKENPDGTHEEFYSKFNPYPVQVSPDAQAVHGMSNEDLAYEPAFKSRAEEIVSFIKGCDLGGYNIINFDIPMLFEELYRSGITHNFKQHEIFDSYKIWTKTETRTLTGAVERYLKTTHEHAHSAKADVIMTAKILKKQLEEYSAKYESDEDMAKQTSELTGKIDFAGKFGLNSNGQVTITFGKYKDKSVKQVFDEDPGYLCWIFEKAEFPTETKLIAKSIYDKLQTIKSNS